MLKSSKWYLSLGISIKNLDALFIFSMRALCSRLMLLFNSTNYIFWRVQVMEPLIMHFSSPSWHFPSV
jgi:hypothetical protein